MLFFVGPYLVCASGEYQVAAAFILTPIVLLSINEMKTTFADPRFPRQINKNENDDRIENNDLDLSSRA